MIKYVQNKNLLVWFEEQKEPCGIIHSCNCFHTMGAGIAKQIALKYPEALEADKRTPYGDIKKLGTFSVATVKNAPNNRIYNVFGQYRYGRDKRYTSYDALAEALPKVAEQALEIELTKLGLPFNMGCKLGGGRWEIVKAIIDTAFSDLTSLDVYICRYES